MGNGDHRPGHGTHSARSRAMKICASENTAIAREPDRIDAPRMLGSSVEQISVGIDHLLWKPAERNGQEAWRRIGAPLDPFASGEQG